MNSSRIFAAGIKLILSAIIAPAVLATNILGSDIEPWSDEYLLVPKEYPTIQSAVDAAVDGDIVLVFPGTYTQNGSHGIEIMGKEITVRSAAGSEYTTIDCELAGRGFYFCYSAGINTRLEGFTIRNGYARYGGGIRCNNSSPSITNCIISGNEAETAGGGISCFRSSSIITNCRISDNHATSSGGGFYCYDSSPTMTDCAITLNNTEYSGGGLYCKTSQISVNSCLILDNSAGYEGGGINCDESSIVVDHCTINGNEGSNGGGIYCSFSPMSIIDDCVISGNETRGLGGGISLRYSDTASITNTFLFDNYSAKKGGGIYCRNSSATVSKCDLTGNAAQRGGGIFCNSYSSSTIMNCTIIANSAGSNGGGFFSRRSNPIICNSILWGNTSGQVYAEAGSPYITYTNIQEGWPGPGNIDSNPHFVRDEWSDYRLLWGSPCIDSGYPDSLDMDGTRSDMGAHYFDQSRELIVYLSPELTELAPGDTGRVNCTVCNPNPYDVSFTAAAGLWLPDGTPWPGNPIEGPVYASISPAANLTGEYEFQAPAGLLPGIYSLAAGVGCRDRIYDLDRFEFTVIDTGEDDGYPHPNDPAEIFASWRPGELR